MSKLIYYIGLDDTDHIEMGCTTIQINNFLNFIKKNLVIKVKELRLVRLWPFASRRTRGNAALSSIIVISKSDNELFLKLSKEWFNDLLFEVSQHPSADISASPALIISQSRLPVDIYYDTVTGHVDIDKRIKEIVKFDCTIFSSDDKFGLIGASAAIAWTPNDSSTWELISWRDDSMIGKPRILDVSKINNLDSIHPNTFMNRDPTKNKGLIAPRTPCPVLYGIRGNSPIDVEKAHIWLQSDLKYEQCIDFKIFRTNQLSDDHVTPSWGTVTCKPTTVQGAHSFISVYSEKKNLTLVAFQEGGPVNALLRHLMPGDIVCWTGLCSPIDNSIHLEKLLLSDSVPRISHRPICCSKSMKSTGNNHILKCIKCGKKSNKYWISKKSIIFDFKNINGWTEPSPSNRRHLSMPLDFEIPILDNLIS